jgi:hypothetical protein
MVSRTAAVPYFRFFYYFRYLWFLSLGTGLLQVEPFATTMVVHKEVHLKDNSLIQFPLMGIAPQPSPFDEIDAPNTFPRGNLTSVNSMVWEG